MSDTYSEDDDDEIVELREEYAGLQQEEQELLKEDLRMKVLIMKNKIAALRARQNVSLCDKTSIAKYSSSNEQGLIPNVTGIWGTSLNLQDSSLFNTEKVNLNSDSDSKLTEQPYLSLGPYSFHEKIEKEDAFPDGRKQVDFASTNIHVNVQVQKIIQMSENVPAKSVEIPDSRQGESGTELDAQPYVLFTKDRILNYLQDSDRSSKRVIDFLRCLCSEAESKFSNVIRIWVGYEKRDKNMPVFVAIVQHRETVGNTFYSFNLKQRLAVEVSSEAKRISEIEKEECLKFSNTDSTRLRCCIAKHSTELMKRHSNILLISASKIKSKDGGDKMSRTPCIVLYVHVKGIIPFCEDLFPTELDGIPVDVREAIFKTFSDPRAYQRRLTMGCQIVNAYEMSGSLGGFVQMPKGKVGCLTVCHMFQTPVSINDYHKDMFNQCHFKRDIYQPHPSATEDFKFGQVVDAKLEHGNETTIGVDAALIEITSPHRVPQNGNFASSDNTNRVPPNFNSGTVIKSFDEIELHADCVVVKHGPITKCTTGKVVVNGVAIKKWAPTDELLDECQLHQQIEITPSGGEKFADRGESGSLVFMVVGSGKNAELRALGMIVGGTTYNTAIATPIWAILESFGLPLQMHPFDNPSRLSKLEEDVRNMHTEINRKIESMSTAINNNSAVLHNVTTAISKNDTTMNSMNTLLHTLVANITGTCTVNQNGQQTHQK